MASDDARIVRQGLVRPTILMCTSKIVGTGADLAPPEPLRYATERRLVYFDDADMAAEPSAPVVNLDNLSGKVSTFIVIADGDMPVPRKVGGGCLGAIENLLQQMIVVSITAPKL